MTLEIVGAPFDLCGLGLGSRLGPEAIRLAGLGRALTELGVPFRDRGDLRLSTREEGQRGLRNFRPLLRAIRAVRSEVLSALKAGGVPLLLGGEHTLSAGSVSAALEAYGEGLGVLWIDAHADLNTPGSSLTGNVHGMPIAALQGLPSETTGVMDLQWTALLEALGPTRLRPERTAHFALRDVDAAERGRLIGPRVTMHDVDLHGIAACVRTLEEWWIREGIERLWISFDVDALDPVLAPGTGTAVRGGLSYREAHLLAELLHGRLGTRLAGVDLVETNPLHDRSNETASMGIEWLASLFGKTILGGQA